MRSCWGTLLGVAGVIAGCANGGPNAYDDGNPGTGDDASISGDATRGSSGGSGSGSGSGGGSGSSSGSGSGSGGQGDDSGTGDDAGSSGGGDGGGTTTCTAPDTCMTATNLGTIPGDESGPTLTASGSTADWLVIDMQEKDNSIVGVPMKLTATLTSPPGSTFELYAYLGGSPGAVECTTVKQAGSGGMLSFDWGETGAFANGVDDSRMVTLEVRYVSGTCPSGQPWTLSAHGH